MREIKPFIEFNEEPKELLDTVKTHNGKTLFELVDDAKQAGRLACGADNCCFDASVLNRADAEPITATSDPLPQEVLVFVDCGFSTGVCPEISSTQFDAVSLAIRNSLARPAQADTAA